MCRSEARFAVIRRIASLAVLVILLTSVTGCDWFEDPSPETVRVVVSASDPGAQLDVLVSTKFVAARNEGGQYRVETIESDRGPWTLPRDATYDITNDYRFLFQGLPLDENAVTVTLEVYIDGQQRHRATVEVRPDRPIRFIYMFNQPIAADFELL